MEAGDIREGLWAQALVKLDGDSTKAKIEYMKLRVQFMRVDLSYVKLQKKNMQQKNEHWKKRVQNKKRLAKLAKKNFNVWRLTLSKNCGDNYPLLSASVF